MNPISVPRPRPTAMTVADQLLSLTRNRVHLAATPHAAAAAATEVPPPTLRAAGATTKSPSADPLPLPRTIGTVQGRRR